MKYRQAGQAAIALVIDDDPFIRLLARDALEKIGLQVEEANDGASGLAAIAALAPDIILLDVMMPDMDGFAVCRQARRLPGIELTPILMLTAPEDTDSINQAYEAGATDFISKPIDWPILRHLVRYMLKASDLLRDVAKNDFQLAKSQRLTSVESANKCEAVHGFNFTRPVTTVALSSMLQSNIDLPVMAEPAGRQRTVLLLDDEPNTLSALARLFRRDGYQILQAQTPVEAFELLAAYRVQVIISGQRMPLMSGTAFLGKVKELYPDTIRIILSGYTELTSVIDAINGGAVIDSLPSRGTTRSCSISCVKRSSTIG